MNRLQKKCLVASSAFHGLLVLIILFGAALMPEAKNTAVNRITFFDMSKVTDGPTVGGGSAGQSQPQPQLLPPPVPQPMLNQQAPTLPEPPRHETPRPPDEFKAKPAPDAPSFKPAKPKPRTDDFAPVDHATPKPKQVASNNQQAQSEARARAEAAARQRALNQINNGIKKLGTSLSKDPGVQVEGGNNSGAAAANYGDAIKSIYDAAWNSPASVTDDSLFVIVSVTIARDGHVIRHEIITPSGNTDMDRSIESVLENVTEVPPFPAGSTQTERTYKIKMDLSAKRGT